MLLGKIAGALSAGGAAPSFSLSGALSTSSGSSPVTSATRTVTGSGTALFNNITGLMVAVEYSKNGGAWTAITEGLTLALANPDTIAVRSTIAIAPNSTTFDLHDNLNGARVEAVTLERT